MDEKIKELKSAVTEKDTELEQLKETVRLLQEKLEINGGVNRNDVHLNGRDILNGDQEMLEEVDDNN